MYKITIYARAGESSPEEISRRKFVNATEDDSFCDYFNKNLDNLGLTHGVMNFYWNDEKNDLYVRTIYFCDNELTPEQLRELSEYTQGQWSDGIGEGYEQFDCGAWRDGESFISPWYSGQKLTILRECI